MPVDGGNYEIEGKAVGAPNEDSLVPGIDPMDDRSAAVVDAGAIYAFR